MLSSSLRARSNTTSPSKRGSVFDMSKSIVDRLRSESREGRVVRLCSWMRKEFVVGVARKSRIAVVGLCSGMRKEFCGSAVEVEKGGGGDALSG